MLNLCSRGFQTPSAVNDKIMYMKCGKTKKKKKNNENCIHNTIVGFVFKTKIVLVNWQRDARMLLYNSCFSSVFLSHSKISFRSFNSLLPIFSFSVSMSNATLDPFFLLFHHFHLFWGFFPHFISHQRALCSLNRKILSKSTSQQKKKYKRKRPPKTAAIFSRKLTNLHLENHTERRMAWQGNVNQTKANKEPFQMTNQTDEDSIYCGEAVGVNMTSIKTLNKILVNCFDWQRQSDQSKQSQQFCMLLFGYFTLSLSLSKYVKKSMVEPLKNAKKSNHKSTLAKYK